MSVRTITLPINAAASWSQFAWPSKDPADVLDYMVDCTAWLADAGTTVTAVTASLSAGLTGQPPTFANGVVTLQLGAGTPMTVGVVAVLLTLSNGDVLEVLVSLPIRASAPPGLVPVSAASYLTDDAGNTLTDDAGNYLLAG